MKFNIIQAGFHSLYSSDFQSYQNMFMAPQGIVGHRLLYLKPRTPDLRVSLCPASSPRRCPSVQILRLSFLGLSKQLSTPFPNEVNTLRAITLP